MERESKGEGGVGKRVHEEVDNHAVAAGGSSKSRTLISKGRAGVEKKGVQ